MATVIDHIIVELQLDPKKFDESIKKSAEAWMKLRQQAEDSHKDTREPVDAMSKAFGALTTKVLAFAASLLTLQKIAQFTSHVVKTNVSLGNLSTTTGIAVERLSAWANMAARNGSSVESMTQALAGMDKELKEMQVTGGLSGNLAVLINSLNTMGAKIQTPDKATDAIQMWERILEGMDRLGLDKRDRAAFLEKHGLTDPSVTALFARNSAKQIADMVKAQKDIYVVTQQNVDESFELSRRWNELTQRAEALGRVLLHDLAKPIEGLLDRTNKVMQGDVAGAARPVEGADTANKIIEGAIEQRKSRQERIDSLNRRLRNRLDPYGNEETGIPLPTPRPSEAGPGANQSEEFMPRRSLPNRPVGGSNGQTFRGAASFYSGLPSEGGNRTSTGERVDPNSYTGALQSDLAKQYGGLRKGGIWADVTDERTGKKVRVYLNDTGPLRPGRVVDLSPKAFGEFGPLSKGLHQNMRVDVLPPAQGQPYKGGPVTDDPWHHGAPPLPWLSNPRLLRAPRFNQMLNPTQNYATSEMNVHSLIVNSANKPVSDDAYGLSNDAVPTLERSHFMNQMTEGPF